MRDAALRTGGLLLGHAIETPSRIAEWETPNRPHLRSNNQECRLDGLESAPEALGRSAHRIVMVRTIRRGRCDVLLRFRGQK
jgi:hypothetical protein